MKAIFGVMMYEFHGWFALIENAYEDDFESLAAAVDGLRPIVAGLKWPTASADLRTHNGRDTLVLNGLVNRRRYEANQIDLLLAYIGDRLPASYGLLHERADDMPEPPGQGSFRVRVMVRGKLTEHPDPFFSPANPTIED